MPHKRRLKFIIDLHVLLVNSKHEILLLRRYNTGYQDGNYSLPAGHLDKDETPINGAIREAKEEIGIEIDPEDISLCHTMYHSSDTPRLGIFFNIKSWSGKASNKEPNKCDDLKWFDVKKLPSNIVPYIKCALNAIKKEIPYSEFYNE